MPHPDAVALPLRPPRVRRGARVLAWCWLASLNLFLLSPVLLYELGLSSAKGGVVDKIALFALPASVLWLAVVQRGGRPWVVHALLFPFYGFVATDLYFIFHYDTRLTSSTITLLLENSSSAGDYWKTHFRAIAGAVALASLFYLAGLFAIRRLVFRPPRWSRLGAPLALVVLYGTVLGRQCASQGFPMGVIDVVSHDRNSPFGVIPQSVVAYRVFRDVLAHQRLAGSFLFGATRTATPSESELFVVVIGESARRDHWGVYGYDRDTTPRLAAEPNLVVFTNVVSQAALTQISVPLILTRSSVDDHDLRLGEPSILSVFKEVGFTTSWFSTQQRDQYTGAINRYTDEADHPRFLDRQYDGALVELLAKAVGDPSNTAHRQLFVLHTQGSHGDYRDRFPRAFERFPVDGSVSAHQRVINAYDDSVAYTDQVLSQAITLLERHGGISALFYVADHGENLKDDGRALLGHFFNNEYDLPIPMVLWYSGGFARRYPAKVDAAKQNRHRPLSTRSAFFTLADLVNADFGDPHQRTLSVLSDALVDAPRMVLRRWVSVTERESVDFDRPHPAMAVKDPAGPGGVAGLK